MRLEEAKQEMLKFVKLKTTMEPVFVDVIMNQTAEIIRCKDCVHYDTDYIWPCALNAVKVGEDDFCSRGERKAKDD